MLLTHIHLDHAGRPGCSSRRLPGLRVYVSEVGAPHLVEPEKLLRERRASLRRGEHGAALGRGRAGAGGERRRARGRGGGRGLPGRAHARPRQPPPLLARPREGDAYVGDMAGVRIPPREFTLRRRRRPRSTSRPGSTRSTGSRRSGPQRLRLTHFGAAEDVGAQLDRVRESAARAGGARPSRGSRGFLARFEAEIDAERRPGDRRARCARRPRPSSNGWASSATGASDARPTRH